MQKFTRTLLMLVALAMTAATVGCAHDGSYSSRTGAANDTNNAQSSYGDGPMGENQ